MAIIQVWSAPSCQAGAVCFGALAPWVAAAGSEATGTPASFRVTVTRDVADAASLADGRCLRVISQSRGEQWWFVSSVSDSDGDAALVNVTAGPLAQLLTVRGLVRSGSTFSFTPGKRTVTDVLTTYVLTNLADDGLSWISLGTVDYPDTVEIGGITRETRASVLNKLESATGDTARLRGLYSAGVLTGFALDVVSDIAAGLDTIPLSVGAQVTQLQRTRDALRAATVVVPFAADGLPMRETEWVIGTVTTTSAPAAWVTLSDPVAGNPAPIREDDQLIGAFLMNASGTTTAITDSRVSDSAVLVADATGFTAGGLVTFVRSAVGREPVVELSSPSGLATSRGRLVGTVSTRVSDGRRNLARNGALTAFTSNQLTHWSNSGANMQHTEYPRSTPLTWTATLAVAIAPGVSISSIQYTGATPGTLLLSRERIRIGTGGAAFAVVVDQSIGAHRVDGTGAGTLPINTITAPSSQSIGVPVTLVDNNGNPGSGRRPTSIPADENAGSSIVALVADVTDTAYPPVLSQRRLQSPTTYAVFDNATPYIHAAAGVTMRAETTTSSGTLFRENVGLFVFDPVSSTVLAWARIDGSVQAGDTVHQTLTCNALLSASRPVAVGVLPCDYSKATSYVRWVSLWMDGASPSTMTARGSAGSNTLWHRGQDVLASAAQGTRYVVRGLDLVRLVQEIGAPALGQSVRLRSDLLGINPTVKIVKLDYVFDQTELLNLELGAIVPRLSGVTVSL